MRDDDHRGDPAARPPGCTCSVGAGGEPSQCPACGTPPPAKMVPILEMRAFSFTGLNAAQEKFVVLCPALCVLAYTRLRLSVRVHARTMSSGQLLRFHVWNTLPSDEDPAQDFVESSTLLTADISSATIPPALVTSSLASDPDAYVKISLRATQGSTPVPFTATLSASLMLRMD